MAARNPDGIKWLGVFQALSGYPQGIHPENALGRVKPSASCPCPRAPCCPASTSPPPPPSTTPCSPPSSAAASPSSKWIFEANNLRLYRGTANAVEAAVNNQRAYQAAAAKYLEGAINCMAHYTPGIFNTAASAMTRVAQNYHKGNAANARALLYNCYGNLPWAGQTVWGDHDMFHSSDTLSARMMAVAKAMSGGTVYLSDAVDRFNKDLIAPLCYKDGRILRPLAPAAPLSGEPLHRPRRGTLSRRCAARQRRRRRGGLQPQRPREGNAGICRPARITRTPPIMMQPYPGPLANAERRPAGVRLARAQSAAAERTVALRRCPRSPTASCCCARSRTAGPSSAARTNTSPRPESRSCRAPRAALVLRMPESGPVTIWTARGKPSSKAAQFQPAGRRPLDRLPPRRRSPHRSVSGRNVHVAAWPQSGHGRAPPGGAT